MAISDTGNTLEGEERNLKRVKSYDPGSEGDHESDGGSCLSFYDVVVPI